MSEDESTKRFETRQSVEFSDRHRHSRELSYEADIKLFGMLHLPEQQLHVPPFPVVLMIHGLAGTKVGRHRLYVRLAEKLSQKGIASLRVDMRGCGDSEGDFADITIETQIHDVLEQLKFLAKHPLICKERIGILGRSMGGAIAVLAAEQARKREFIIPCSMLLWCPLFTAQSWKQEWQAKRQGDQKHHVADQGIFFQGAHLSMKLLHELFALNLLPALESLRDIPFFFAHSVNDPVVSIEQTHQYLEQRNSVHHGAVAETRFRPFYGKDHEFSLPDEQVDLLEESVQWFQHTLSGQKRLPVIQRS